MAELKAFYTNHTHMYFYQAEINRPITDRFMSVSPSEILIDGIPIGNGATFYNQNVIKANTLISTGTYTLNDNESTITITSNSISFHLKNDDDSFNDIYFMIGAADVLYSIILIHGSNDEYALMGYDATSYPEITNIRFTPGPNHIGYGYFINNRYGGSVNVYSFNKNLLRSAEPVDPYHNAGYSQPDDSQGAWAFNGDNICIPNLPTVSAYDTGFLTLFNPSAAGIKSLAQYMWSAAFDLDTFKKIFADPMDCLLGLSILPVTIPHAASATNVKIGNIDTGISFYKASAQYVSVDCGSISLSKYFGSYLDYAPYSKLEIYLPFIGTRPLDIDDAIGKTIQVVYHVDILSGACVAYIKMGDTVKYTYSGNCALSIPMTGSNWGQLIGSGVKLLGSLGAAAAAGGLTAATAAGAAINTATNTSIMKPSIERTGNLSGNTGMLAAKIPYLIYTRPRLCLPEGQNALMGYPSFVTKTIADISGYTQVDEIHLEGIPATSAELDEIERILKEGFIA